MEYRVELSARAERNLIHLYEQIRNNDIDEPWLNEIERRHNIFPHIDYRVYA